MSPPRTTSPNEIEDDRQMIESRWPDKVLARIYTELPTPLTITVAPDNTCGFITGGYWPMTCINGKTCSWESGKLNAILCGLEGFFTTCLGRDDALDPDICGDSCKSDWHIRLCTVSSLAWCKTKKYQYGVMDYGCASEESTVTISFNRGNRDLEFRTTVLGDTSGSTTLPESKTLFKSTTGPKSTTWTESTTLTETSTSTGPLTSTTGIDTTSTSGPRGNNNTGSIVGGVLGGLALVCFMILGVMFLRHRGRHAPSVTNPNPDRGHIKAELDVTPSPNAYPATSTLQGSGQRVEGDSVE
ncbi:hypothetical protein BGZ61DRAFT_476537 [Ilyonectria robusta]|uniref:uncharacterized protein n=1 Tax=Ilyonectria robusta TaxID=1079257 RepID=UPI001E8EB51B|nr:uncharacterized protein BGZ61DRAFT_476537 [Ilyonectria robusta]KAH8714460.1 hypothetical protein BGZ61DRAFT_476537 [Ilyonectria robusta]